MLPKITVNVEENPSNGVLHKTGIFGHLLKLLYFLLKNKNLEKHVGHEHTGKNKKCVNGKKGTGYGIGSYGFG